MCDDKDVTLGIFAFQTGSMVLIFYSDDKFVKALDDVGGGSLNYG